MMMPSDCCGMYIGKDIGMFAICIAGFRPDVVLILTQIFFQRFLSKILRDCEQQTLAEASVASNSASTGKASVMIWFR